MAKKGTNDKKEAGNAKKAAAKAEKDNKKAAANEAAEADKWAQGSKGKNVKKEDAEAKKAAAAAKKAEAARLLAEEEKQFKSKPTLKGVDKKAAQKLLKMKLLVKLDVSFPNFQLQFGQVKDVEKHPERRFKAAFAAFEERELPNFKRDNPGLRLSQLKELIYKAFQKSPENPFNQANIISYNATEEEAKSMKANKNKAIEDRLRTN
ncbi:unnamed protein product [Mucor hiemalis]